jgi:hypothetical protein
MKYWWVDVVKDYFTFSAKERNGLIIMFSIAAVFFLFSRYLPERKDSVTKDAFQKELAELKIVVDSSGGNKSYQGNENYVDYSEPKPNGYANNFKRELFNFDPNTLDGNGWKRLGVREKTVNTIQNFLAKVIVQATARYKKNLWPETGRCRKAYSVYSYFSKSVFCQCFFC